MWQTWKLHVSNIYKIYTHTILQTHVRMVTLHVDGDTVSFTRSLKLTSCFKQLPNIQWNLFYPTI